jgi:6-phosphogluconolactonase (cycloisomerase 2 family)
LDGTLVVSEAVGAMPNLGTVSSYRLGTGAAPGLVSASVHTGQTAPCWVAITDDDAYAYSANTPAGTITGFAIDVAGGLSLLGDAGQTASTGAGSRPADLALSHHGRFLYVLEAGAHRIGAYQVQRNGALVEVQVPGAGELPTSTVGLVAL